MFTAPDNQTAKSSTNAPVKPDRCGRFQTSGKLRELQDFYWKLANGLVRFSVALLNTLDMRNKIQSIQASLLAKRPLCPAQILSSKQSCLKDTCRHGLNATKPCANAYSQARIRRLVRFEGGFYCGPVADESAIGFSDPDLE